MERRKTRRKILDFEEFPLSAEFSSGIVLRFQGHIQNISPGGLCLVLLNTNQSFVNNTKGSLSLTIHGKKYIFPAVIKWVDTTKHLIRFAGVEVDPELLEPIMEELFPDFYQ